MSNPRLSIALENGRFVKVTMWQNEPRLDLREWDIGQQSIKATKKGISLKLHQVKSLSDAMNLIQESLEKNEELKWHLEYNVYVSVRENNSCIDIRQYWKPPQQDESVPTRKGLCLRPQEHDNFAKHWESIKNAIPELETFVPCYQQDDHLNQLGMLRCPACNPDDYINW
jgi:hypothetical protein